MSSVTASTIDSSLESVVDELVDIKPIIDESNNDIIKNESCNEISEINPLIAAVNNGNVDLVKQLLESSIDVNVEDSDGKFPLLIASLNGFSDIVKILIDAKADIDKELGGVTSIAAASAYAKHVEILKLLIDGGANVNIPLSDGRSPLYLATASDDLELVAIFIDAKADLNTSDSEQITPLMLAASNNQIEIVKALVAAGCQLDLKMNNGKTALILAVERGFADVVNYLINANADLTIYDSERHSAVYYACEYNYVDILAQLIDAGVNIDKQLESLLSIAAENNYVDIIAYFVNNDYELDPKDHYSSVTPLFIAAEKGYVDIVKLLIKGKLDINNRNSTRYGYGGYMNAISAAALNQQFEIVKILIEANADLDTTVLDGYTILYYISKKGYYEIAKLLIDANADVNRSDPLNIAMKEGHMDIAQLLLNANAKIWDAQVNLRYAIEYKHIEFVNLFLSLDVNVDFEYPPDYYGQEIQTPLSIAIEVGFLDIVKVLLDHNVDINEISNGNTAISGAARYGRMDVVMYLVEMNADLRISHPMSDAIKSGGNIAYSGIGIDGCNQRIYPSNNSFVPKWKEGTVVGVLIDKTTDELFFSFDGELIETEHPISIKDYQQFLSPAFTLQNLQTSELIINFGETPLQYKPLDYLSVYEYSISKYHTFPDYLEFSNFKKECWEPLTPSIGCMKRYYNDLTDAFIDPSNRSSTSLVLFANDLQIVDIYSEVFIQAVREEVVNENKSIKSKSKQDSVEKNYDGLLSLNKFIKCVNEIRIKLGVTVQSDDSEVLGQHYQKWKSDLVDGVDHSQFFSYCKSTFGEYHKVAIKFMKNKDQYERELLIRKSHGPYSLDSRYVVLYIDGPNEKHFQREAKIFTKRFTNNQDIMRYGFIMPAADRNLENICRQENPDMIHIHTILTDVALSLNSCHDTGLVHNDVKLQNVVRVHNAIKLIDMDAAGAIGHDYCGAKFSSGILPPEMFVQLNDKEKDLYENYWSDLSDIGLKEKIKPKEFIEITGKIKKVKKTHYFVVKTFKAKNLERTLNDIEDADEDDFRDKDDDEDDVSVDSNNYPTDANKISKSTNAEVVILSDESNDDPESLSIPLNSQHLPYKLVNSTPLIDIWSFGILMYRLISRQPFIIVDDDEDIPTGKDIFELINLTNEQINTKINNINRSDCEYQHLEAAKDLMKKLLRINPTNRIESVSKVLEHPYFTGKSDITSDLRKISEMQQQLNNKVDDIKEIVVEIKSITLDIQSSVIDVTKIVQLDTEVSLDIIKQLHLTQETLLRGIFEATEVTIPTCFIIVPEDIMLEMEKKAYDERVKLSKHKNGDGKKKLWMTMPSYVNMAANLTNAYNNQHDFIPNHLLDSVDKIAVDFFLTEYYINLKSDDKSTNSNALQNSLKTDKLSNFIHWLTDVTTTVVNAVNNPIDSVTTYVSSGGNKMYFYLIDELDMTPIIGEPNYPIQITSPSEFAVKYLSFIKIGFKAISMINGLSGIARCFGYPVPSISTECMSSLNTFVNSLDGETSISQYELLQEKALSCYDESITKESKPTSVRGPALRELENFLLLSDPLKKFSSLRRVFTKEGLSMWTCKTDDEIVSYKASLPDDYQIKNNEYKEYIKQNNLKHIKWNNDSFEKIDEEKIVKLTESNGTETDNSKRKVIADTKDTSHSNDSYNKRIIDKQVNSNDSSVSVTQVIPIDKHTDAQLTSNEFNANIASSSPATQ
eukprot:gene19379-25247_t